MIYFLLLRAYLLGAKKAKCNLETYQQRAVRLKGYARAGGGVYAVTVCTHPLAGRVFDVPAVKKMVGDVWESLPSRFPSVGAGFAAAPESPYRVMPDHFHGLIEMRQGQHSLSGVIDAFKSLVAHEYNAGVKRGIYPELSETLWQPHYFETIIKSEKQWTNIAHCIRFNPVHLIISGEHQGRRYRAFGNPGLLEWRKWGVLTSDLEKVACPEGVGDGYVLLSGFHSEGEKATLHAWKGAVIYVAAVGPDHVLLTEQVLARLASGNVLVVCPFDASRKKRRHIAERNRIVTDWADEITLG